MAPNDGFKVASQKKLQLIRVQMRNNCFETLSQRDHSMAGNSSFTWNLEQPVLYVTYLGEGCYL